MHERSDFHSTRMAPARPLLSHGDGMRHVHPWLPGNRGMHHPAPGRGMHLLPQAAGCTSLAQAGGCNDKLQSSCAVYPMCMLFQGVDAKRCNCASATRRALTRSVTITCVYTRLSSVSVLYTTSAFS